MMNRTALLLFLAGVLAYLGAAMLGLTGQGPG